MNKRKPRVGDVVVITIFPSLLYAQIGIITVRQEKVPFSRKGYEIYLGPNCYRKACGGGSPWFYPEEFEIIDHDDDLLEELVESGAFVSEESDNPSVTFQETPSGGLRDRKSVV